MELKVTTCALGCRDISSSSNKEIVVPDNRNLEQIMILDSDHPDFYLQFGIEHIGSIMQEHALATLKTWEPYRIAKLIFIPDAVDEYNQLLISALCETLTSDDLQKNEEACNHLDSEINRIKSEVETDDFREHNVRRISLASRQKRMELRDDLQKILVKEGKRPEQLYTSSGESFKVRGTFNVSYIMGGMPIPNHNTPVNSDRKDQPDQAGDILVEANAKGTNKCCHCDIF